MALHGSKATLPSPGPVVTMTSAATHEPELRAYLPCDRLEGSHASR